jgi:hypothetical protein
MTQNRQRPHKIAFFRAKPPLLHRTTVARTTKCATMLEPDAAVISPYQQLFFQFAPFYRQY